MAHSESNTIATFGMGKKTLKSYITGLGLSLVLTLMSFGIVMHRLFSVKWTFIALATLAILQLLAQVVFFLRMNTNPEGRWNSMPFIFTLIIIAILAGGSLWIMYNMNYNMMN